MLDSHEKPGQAMLVPAAIRTEATAGRAGKSTRVELGAGDGGNAAGEQIEENRDKKKTSPFPLEDPD